MKNYCPLKIKLESTFMAAAYINFKNYKIQNNAESLLLCHDYFLSYPIVPTHALKKIMALIRYLLRLLLRFIYFLRFNTLFPQQIINDEFLVCKKSRRKNGAKITLRRAGGQLVIIKEYYNTDVLDKELYFLSLYGKADSALHFVPLTKINDRTAIMPFIRRCNLAMEICLGDISEKQLFLIYENLSLALDDAYRGMPRNECLVHGDLGPTNVYRDGNFFYVIDFTDAHVYEKEFDKFYFLKRLLLYYYGTERADIMKRYFSFEEINKYSARLMSLKSIKQYDYKRFI